MPDHSTTEPTLKTEAQIDESVKESFPASDPPAIPTAGSTAQGNEPPVVESPGTPDDRPYPFPTAEHHPEPTVTD